MKQTFSTAWNASRQPRKQRKYRYEAPLHLRHRLLSAHLSKDLRTKHARRSFPVIKGDKVKVMRGQYAGKEGKVERVDLKESKVFLTGIERLKKDGSKSLYPITASNVLIMDLNLSDQRRKGALSRGTSTKNKQVPSTMQSTAQNAHEAKPTVTSKLRS
ncbi:50S ribosomal protein L24 [Candidatus Woesearchaeota archaeon]|nr:50S ribosomal protein L24 [Candidatus Woesearchaeota archaeon]